MGKQLWTNPLIIKDSIIQVVNRLRYYTGHLVFYRNTHWQFVVKKKKILLSYKVQKDIFLQCKELKNKGHSREFYILFRIFCNFLASRHVTSNDSKELWVSFQIPVSQLCFLHWVIGIFFSLENKSFLIKDSECDQE